MGEKVKVIAAEVAIIAVAAAGYCAIKSCSNKVQNDEVSTRSEQRVEEVVGEKEFAPGEHVLSVTMDKPDSSIFSYNTEDTIQLPSQDGYRVIGVSMEGYQGCILYENTDYVYCVPTGKTDDNKYVYTNFGRPQNIDDSYNENNGKKRFEVGEHVILKPISNPDSENVQYSNITGYEIIGIDYAVEGRSYLYAGGYIIYRNTVPVECIKEEKGYTSFGTPIKTKTLAKNN